MTHPSIMSSIVAGAMAAALAASAAFAAPLPIGDGVAASSGSAVIKVHEGCHYDNRYSPRFGLHNHSNAECRAESPRPRGYGYERRPESYGGYSGRNGGERHGGGHPCHYDCRYSPEFGWHNHSNAQCRPEPCRGR